MHIHTHIYIYICIHVICSKIDGYLYLFLIARAAKSQPPTASSGKFPLAASPDSMTASEGPRLLNITWLKKNEKRSEFQEVLDSDSCINCILGGLSHLVSRLYPQL